MLLSGSLGNSVKISLDVVDPLTGVSFSLLDNLLLISRKSSLGSESLLSGFSSFLVGFTGSLTNESCVGVKLVKSFSVVKGVVLVGSVKNSVLFAGSNGTLNLIGVNNSGDIGVSNLTVRKTVSLLLGRSLSPSSENIVQLLEGSLSPDDESSDVSSWGKLEEIKSADMSNFNSGNVSKSFNEGNISTTVDNQRSSSGSVSSVSELSFSSSNFNGVDNLLNISPGSSISKELNGFFGSFNLLNLVANNEGKFGNVINSVSSGLNKRKDS